MTNEEALNDMLRKTFPRTIFIRGINEMNKTQSVVFTDEWLKMPCEAINALRTEHCDDCIGRQAVDDLVDELARAISDERCCITRGRSTATIMQDILELPSVQPAQKWIPVNERLPEENEEVLVTFKSDDEIRVYNCKYFDNSPWWKNYVIAWMPLPEPYKAESEVQDKDGD